MKMQQIVGFHISTCSSYLPRTEATKLSHFRQAQNRFSQRKKKNNPEEHPTVLGELTGFFQFSLQLPHRKDVE